MGCDIHLHTEVKINGVWHHYSCPSVRRFYNVFARMANVRNQPDEREFPVEPIALPRGLPSDISAVTAFSADRWADDGHSHSWLDAKEIASLYDYVDDYLKIQAKLNFMSWCTENFGYFEGNDWKDFLDEETYEYFYKGIEDIRFVFWFDN